jgi:hypothetical protein
MMNEDPITFESLVEQFAGQANVAAGKWFGKTCLKVDGKAFLVSFGGDIAFKLAEDARAEALSIEGAHLFDPRGQGNAFKEWVQVPGVQARRWPQLAERALEFVGKTLDR